MSDLIRSSALTGFSDLVLELGGDPNTLLRCFHWSSDMIEQGDVQISYRSLIQLMEATAATLDRTDFGLQLARKQGLSILGPLAIIMLNSPTVGDAWRSMIRQLDYYSPVCIARLDTSSDPGNAVFSFEAGVAGAPNRGQTMELAIGISFRDLEVLTDQRFVPKAVLFCHEPISPQSTYLEYFGVRAKFGQPINGIVFSAEHLAWPLKSGNPALRQIVSEYVQQAIPSHPLDVEPRLIFLIRHLLAEGRVTLRSIAGQLCIHERTLQRRLELQGKTFDGVLDEVRHEQAEKLLTESDLSMAQICARLGYSEQSSFNKACKRWFGGTPLEIRRRNTS